MKEGETPLPLPALRGKSDTADRQTSREPCLDSTSGLNQFHFRIKVLKHLQHLMCKSILLVLRFSSLNENMR